MNDKNFRNPILCSSPRSLSATTSPLGGFGGGISVCLLNQIYGCQSSETLFTEADERFQHSRHFNIAVAYDDTSSVDDVNHIFEAPLLNEHAGFSFQGISLRNEPSIFCCLLFVHFQTLCSGIISSSTGSL